jgi:asparagine synthase (glutamine-hydrolysing)
MCGIAGFYGFEHKTLLADFSKQLEHRGPDGEGKYVDPQVSLLNRRLAIIDRAGGDQPIFNEDKTIAVVYNGEIYNYAELRAELIKAGHTFKTESDTEVVVHGYEEWGVDSFNKYNGMFAVALYDTKTKALILARDHFGIKPLYYSFIKNPASKESNQLIFASEIKPLIASGLIPKKPNEKQLYRYLKYRIHDDGEETFFEGVYHLMPGQVMTIMPNNTNTYIFSHLETELVHKKAEGPLPKGAAEKFRTMLEEAVKLRLISEVPVGSCLSGGLDSSTVVALINQFLDKQDKDATSVGAAQNTFSAVFPGAVNDEETYINEVCEGKSLLRSHKIYPTAEEFFEDITDFVRTQEEPTISTGPYAQFKVMQEVKNHVTVLLDGQGADEMMAGYLPYYFVYLRQLRKQGKWGTLLAETASSADILQKYAKLKATSRFSTKVSMSKLLGTDFATRFAAEKYFPIYDDLKRRLVRDIFHDSLPSLLRYEDKNSMRFSVEGRVPFLDFNLIRYIFSLPDEAIIKGGWNKNILRQAMKGSLPKRILERRNKIGFTTPEEEWFMRMKNRIYAIFLSESFAGRPYFNQQEVLGAFEDYIQGKNSDSLLFWRIINVELWLREFFDGKTEGTKKARTFNAEIVVDKKTYTRTPLPTELFKAGDDFAQKIAAYVVEHMKQQAGTKKWLVVVSEKIVAIAQGRSFLIEDIRPTWSARALSKFVVKTPYGIGLGSPWTMQLAIQEAGLGRIVAASAIAAVMKPLGIKGMFYRIAGHGVNEIDGPTEYSLYPSNVSAKLGPKDPEKAAWQIRESIKALLQKNKALKSKLTHFGGVAIIDANDLGRNVLGNATDFKKHEVEDMFADNPMGQERQQTPVTVVTF